MPRDVDEKVELKDMLEATHNLAAIMYAVYMQRQLEQANKVPGKLVTACVTTDLQGPPYRWVQLAQGKANRESVILSSIQVTENVILAIAADDIIDPYTLGIDYANGLSVSSSGTFPGSKVNVLFYSLNVVTSFGVVTIKTKAPLYAFAFTATAGPPPVFTPKAVAINVIENIYDNPQSIPEMLGADTHANAGKLLRPQRLDEQIFEGEAVFRSPVLR